MHITRIDSQWLCQQLCLGFRYYLCHQPQRKMETQLPNMLTTVTADESQSILNNVVKCTFKYKSFSKPCIYLNTKLLDWWKQENYILISLLSCITILHLLNLILSAGKYWYSSFLCIHCTQLSSQGNVFYMYNVWCHSFVCNCT